MATFKEIIESYGKELSFGCTAYKSNGTLYKSITEEDVVSENLRFDGALYTCVMRCLDAVLVGDHRDLVKDSRFSACRLTAKKGSDSKTINYGTFYIGEAPEYDEAENTTKFICYDSMYKTTKPYALEGVTFPITLKEYARKIFAACGLVCANLDDLKNGSKLVTEDRYKNAADDSGSAYTYRDVLDDIAKSAGCSFAFKSNANGDIVDRVYVVYVTDGNGNMKAPLHTLDISNFKSLTIGEHYGPANTVVFSRQPQEDNVYLRSSGVTDETAVEVKLTQPLTAEGTDEERGAWLSEILNAVRGTEYRCYSLESYGIGYLNFGDVFKIKAYKRNGRTFDYDSPEEYLSVFMRCDMMLNGDIKESSKLEMPVATATDYNAAATPGEKKLLQAYMKVDKQLGEIVSVVKDPENGLETLVKQTAAGLLVNAKAVETIKTKQEELEGFFSEIDIEGTVTTEVQKETTINIIAGKIEGIISGKYASKSDLGNYVKNETYTARIEATDKQITSSVERISKIEAAGYITESEAESIIDSKADSIAMRVTSKLNIGTRNILLDSACFEGITPKKQYTDLVLGEINEDSTVPSGKARKIGFEYTREGGNGLGGISFQSENIIGQNSGKIEKIVSDRVYTLSFWAKGDSTATLSKINLVYAGSGISVNYIETSDLTVTNSWKKYKVVFKLESKPTDFDLRFFFSMQLYQTYVISISSLKLEEGNVATDWTPCVQDTEQFVEARLELCVKTDENGNLQSAIHAKANQITIESDYFQLTADGKVTATSGLIGGWTINKDELSAETIKTYPKMTQDDVTVCTNLSLKMIPINDELLKKYDLNGDGIVNSTDLAIVSAMATNNENYKQDVGTVKIDPGNFDQTIFLSCDTCLGGHAETSIGVFSVRTPSVICTNITTKTAYITGFEGATPVSGKSYAWLAVEVKTGKVITVGG